MDIVTFIFWKVRPLLTRFPVEPFFLYQSVGRASSIYDGYRDIRNGNPELAIMRAVVGQIAGASYRGVGKLSRSNSKNYSIILNSYIYTVEQNVNTTVNTASDKKSSQ